MPNQHLSRAGWTATCNTSRVLPAASTARFSRGGVVALSYSTTAASADDANPQPRQQSDVQHCTPLPKRQSLGELLLQQSSQQQPMSLGQALLQQPVIHLQQRPLHLQQQQLWQQQRQQPQQQPHQAQRQQQQQPQQQPRAALPHSLSQAPQPQHPAALSAADGYMISRRERYMAPQAAELQGQTWCAPSIGHLEAAVEALPPHTAAAAAARVAADPSVNLADVSRKAGSAGSMPRLFFALQALVAERQAASPAAGEAEPDSSNAGTNSSAHRKPSRPRSSSSSSSGEHSTIRAWRRTSSVAHRGSEADINSQDLPSASISSSRHPAAGRQPNPTYSSNSSSSSRQNSSSSSGNGHGPTAAYVKSAAAPVSHSSSSRHQSNSPSNSSHSAASRGRQPSSQLYPQQQPGHPLSSYHELDALVLLQLQDALLEQHGIELQDLSFGQHRAQLCPLCAGGSSGEKSLAVKVTEQVVALWKCHRATCDWTGRFSLPGTRPTTSSSRVADSSRQSAAAGARRQEGHAQVPPTPVPAHVASQLQPLSPDVLAWLQQERSISPAVLRRNRVSMVYRPGPSIAFPYYAGGHVVNIKYRTLDKRFSQVKGGSQVLYGVNDLQGAREAYIVEGELDKLAIETASGLTSVLSLPGGALPAPKDPTQRPNINSKKLACVDQAAAQLAQLRRVVIAVDGDGPGWATAEALAQKLQQVRQQQQHAGVSVPRQEVLYLPWPAAWNAGGTLQRVAQAAGAAGLQVDLAAAAGCKDANDVLRTCGPAFLKLYLQMAPTIPQ